MTITDFTALTIRLPMLDQATLSQAWRDALHETMLRPERRIVSYRSRLQGAVAAGRSCLQSPTREHLQRRMPVQHTQAALKHRSLVLHAPERKQHTLDCRKAFSPKQVPVLKQIGREQFTLTLANGERLCFVVVPARQGLMVTVLCAPHVQADIRRALASISRTCAHRAIALNVVPFGSKVHG